MYMYIYIYISYIKLTDPQPLIVWQVDRAKWTARTETRSGRARGGGGAGWRGGACPARQHLQAGSGFRVQSTLERERACQNRHCKGQ